MMKSKKRMMNFRLMGIPPDMFYIYMISDSDARKIFKTNFPLSSFTVKKKRGLDFLHDINYLKTEGEHTCQRN
jgi:hypothetical protein